MREKGQGASRHPGFLLLCLPRWLGRGCCHHRGYYLAGAAIHRHDLSVPEQFSRIPGRHNRRNPILPGDDRRVGKDAPRIGHQGADTGEEDRPDR
jgi:hypothetical protein